MAPRQPTRYAPYPQPQPRAANSPYGYRAPPPPNYYEAYAAATVTHVGNLYHQHRAIRMTAQEATKLLWNPENVKDVAESVGIQLPEDTQRILTQDVEYRLGQIIQEGLRLMRGGNRTTLSVSDVIQAMRVLNVEPLYGYEATRPLRYGEASLGPGQPLFYIEDEEIDFEKLINAPLPRVPRDCSFTTHWLSIEGVQPLIPQNPMTGETSSKELLPKGPGANPALVALAGHDNVAFRPAVKHVISKELVLYFDKIQAAVLDDDLDEEKGRLRTAALESVRIDPGLHQLLPYFVNFITNQVTHRLDDIFVLRQMMELASAIIQNEHVFLDPYATALCAPVLTCMMARKLGSEEGTDAIAEQNGLREMAASLVGIIAKKYTRGNTLLRPKLTRTCLKQFLDPTRSPAVHYGAINGLANAGGPEAIRVLVLPNLKDYDAAILQPLLNKGEASAVEFEMLVNSIMKGIMSIVGGSAHLNGVNGVSSHESAAVIDFLGPIIGERVAQLGNHSLNEAILVARNIE